MRIPLFAILEYARNHYSTPADLKHSGILSLEWFKKRNKDRGRIEFEYRSLWFLSWEGPTGFSIVEKIADKIIGNKSVKASAYADLLMRIAKTIYENNTPLSTFRRNRVDFFTSPCGSKNHFGIRHADGDYLTEWSCYFKLKTIIQIAAVPKATCKWCGKMFFHKASVSEHRNVKSGQQCGHRCNSRDCRHIDWLSRTSEGKGGISPKRKDYEIGTSEEYLSTVIAINYLVMQSKEIKKNGRKSTYHVR
jgi:hypothetical protein